MADLYLVAIGEPPMMWGMASLEEAGKDRRTYIKSLRLADKGDYTAILSFARERRT
jgi:hypothetical protein